MVTATARTVLAMAMASLAASGPGSGPEPARSVPSALAKGKYPWYDARGDAFKPVWPPREPDLKWLDRLPKFGKIGSIGELITIGLAMLALAVFLVVLVELWRRHRPVEAPSGAKLVSRLGSEARVEGLPTGVSTGADDPWDEALRRRERGDYAGAVICLFAHQLLTLDRLRLIRLVPGRTGRQLIRTIVDPQWRACVAPTLRLFESVYYGRRTPTREAFEAVWTSAEAFERRVAAGTAS